MKIILKKLLAKEILTEVEAADTMHIIAKGMAKETEISALLEGYNLRKITNAELTGFIKTILSYCSVIEVNKPTIDVCGTGGDGKNSFNISTLAAIAISAFGLPVTKHGNYGASAASGSSTVLEALGYNFTNNADTCKAQLEATNFTYFHAPLFHSCLKHVAPVRKAIGTKTFFNMLGPLLNPVQTAHHFNGVYHCNILPIYETYLKEKKSGYFVFHSHNGYDEITLTDDVYCYTNNKNYTLKPTDFITEALPEKAPLGGENIKEATSLFKDIINGKAAAEKIAIVAANAAQAISFFKNDDNQKHYYNQITAQFIDGSIAKHFQKIIDASK
jgi:anthranilate phosphoribosyltransferase